MFLNWNAYHLSRQNSPIQNSHGNRLSGADVRWRVNVDVKRVIKQPPLFVCVCSKEPLRWPDRCCFCCRTATPTPRGAQAPQPRLQHPEWRGPAGACGDGRAEDVRAVVSSHNRWVYCFVKPLTPKSPAHKLLPLTIYLTSIQSITSPSVKTYCFLQRS